MKDKTARSVTSKLPSWIQEFKRRTAIIEVFAMAYENDCNCLVCERLREIGEDMGQMFIGGGQEGITTPGFKR